MWKYIFDQVADLSALKKIQVAPPIPGPQEVLVKVKAVSLNRADLLMLTGFRPQGTSSIPGLAPLMDAAGEVVAAGQKVTRWKIGDRVMPTILRSWISGDFSPAGQGPRPGWTVEGVLAEQISVDEQALVRIPEFLSDEEAATLPCAGLTAWNSLFDRHFPLQAGEDVLVLGTGGVSVFATQFATLAGANVIDTSSSDAKLDQVKTWGAVRTINYRTDPSWGDTVRRLTDGRGVDHVVETVGAPTLEQSFRSVKLGGAIHLVGVLGRGTIDPELFRNTRGYLRAVAIGSRDQFEAMTRAISARQLKPVIAKVFPLEEVAAAYTHLRDESPVGKVVIRTTSPKPHI